MEEKINTDLSMLSINCYSDNDIHFESREDIHYSMESRYLYIYRWLMSITVDVKSYPDIICFQNFDKGLWKVFNDNNNRDNELFKQYFFIYSFFDNNKLEDFFKFKLNSDVLDKEQIKYLEEAKNKMKISGMAIAININTLDILPSPSITLSKEDFIDKKELFGFEYLKPEYSRNIKEFVNIYWSFHDISFFSNIVYNKYDDYHYEKFSQMITFIHKKTNNPFIINNVALQSLKNNVELQCINSYNKYLKNNFSIEPNIVFVGEIGKFEKMPNLDIISINKENPNENPLIINTYVNHNFNVKIKGFPEGLDFNTFEGKSFPIINYNFVPDITSDNNSKNNSLPDNDSKKTMYNRTINAITSSIKSSPKNSFNKDNWFSKYKSYLYTIRFPIKIDKTSNITLQNLYENIIHSFNDVKKHKEKKIFPSIIRNNNIDSYEKEDEKEEKYDENSIIREESFYTPKKSENLQGLLDKLKKIEEKQTPKSDMTQDGGNINDVDNALDLLVSSIHKINNLKKDIKYLKRGGTKRKLKRYNKFSKKNNI